MMITIVKFIIDLKKIHLFFSRFTGIFVLSLFFPRVPKSIPDDQIRQQNNINWNGQVVLPSIHPSRVLL